jgi:hypothetical protein
MACQLICIPLDLVPQIWPRVSGLIYVAIKKGGISSFAPVEQAVRSGRAKLFVAWDGAETILAAAVIEVVSTEFRNAVCEVVACGGKQMERWLHFMNGIEEWARDQGCSAVRVIGRRGWLRALDGYHEKRLVIEKVL